ncbi:MAG: YbaK/EbsC family protein [Deltaproteobacteria bacterium]|jgi:prolyl-tRNA editing enzyme YbaK/EbsC (Cys-tRNA(Pro) deacylase)|nr:YbaK/EbsC family protein [Deltaproteobacteria bacterium]
MSVESVREHMAKWGKSEAVIEHQESTATVELAARAVGVIPARIAKTMSFKGKAPEDESSANIPVILLVTAGDARVDNGKFKQQFGLKSKMLTPEEALAGTGHAVGGVCPFALTNPLAEVYLDLSMKRFSTVFPACGSSNSAIELTCDELFEISGAKEWVDVCKDWNDL